MNEKILKFMVEKAEGWKDLPGFKGLYQVSDKGTVRSIDRVDGLMREKKGSILAQSINRYGYPEITLCLHGNNKTYVVHRLIASAFLDDFSVLKQVDHKDGDRNNNNTFNLRMTNQSFNNANARKLKKNSSSKYKGVSFHKREQRWVAVIRKDYKYIQCGYFKDEIEAAIAYDKKAVELYGEFAMTNKRMGLYAQAKEAAITAVWEG